MADDELSNLMKFLNDPAVRALISDDDWARLEESRLKYLQSIQQDDFAQARLEDSTRALFRATVRLVDAYRREPHRLDEPGDSPSAAVRARIRRLIDEGGEVDDALVQELVELNRPSQ